MIKHLKTEINVNSRLLRKNLILWENVQKKELQLKTLNFVGNVIYFSAFLLLRKLSHSSFSDHFAKFEYKYLSIIFLIK